MPLHDDSFIASAIRMEIFPWEREPGHSRLAIPSHWEEKADRKSWRQEYYAPLQRGESWWEWD